jgi:transposase
MMGRLNHDQRQLFYSFCLDEVIPDDHLVRAIASVLDLSWVHKELAPHYSTTGRPSIDPVLMIRMLIVGYVLAIRSARGSATTSTRRVRRIVVLGIGAIASSHPLPREQTQPTHQEPASAASIPSISDFCNKICREET